MRVVLQRVKRASVSVGGNVVGEIGAGFLILLGVGQGDTEADADWLVARLQRVRIFEDDAGKMNLPIASVAGNALVVSQFTLFGTMKKGSRPSFNRAAAPAEAKALYEKFSQKLSAALGRTVANGVFGANMEVALVNDGPVTLVLDSKLPDF